MVYFKVAFKVRHECPYSTFSEEFPQVTISHWCNWSMDVVEILSDNLAEENIQDGIRRMFTKLGSQVIRSSNGGDKLQVILQHCSCDMLPPPTLPLIEEYECLDLQPRVYSKGWEYYQVLSFSGSDIKRLIEALSEKAAVRVISKSMISEDAVHDSLLVSASSLIGNLTRKQVWAITSAFENGYYDHPRRANAEEIAIRNGVPRTSFVDHLRKAESKIIGSVFPYLKMIPQK